MALTIGRARSADQNITGVGGANPGRTIRLGSNSGMQPNAPAYDVTLGNGVINQTPRSNGGDNGSGGSNVLGLGTGAPYGGGAVGSVLPDLNMGAIRNTQRAIDEIPGLLEAALAAERTRYGNTGRAFDSQEKAQQGTYDKSTTTNQLNYDANYMDSIRAGVGGLGSLFGILRGTGAAGGTAQDMVRDTVGGVTANDIRTGADTQQSNQTELDGVLSNFLTELKGKRQEAEDTYENNQRAMRRDSQSQLQDLYGKMAGTYADAKRTSDATRWMDKAGDLTPSIARNSITQQSKYDTSPVKVQAPQLTDFAAPSQPDVASTPADGQVGSGIFTMGRREDRDRQNTQPTALPIGS